MFDLNKIFADHVEDNEIEPKQSLSHENLEQKDIKFTHSVEEDEEESFAGNDDDDQSSGSSDSDASENSSDDSDEWGDDSDMEDMDTSNIEDSVDGGDEMSGSDDSGDDADDNSGEGEDKKTETDKNPGSTLNPFAQTNQKLWLLSQMNLLRSSISNAIDQYNGYFADSAELRQLKQLMEIVTEERKSFIMSQNPENLIKYQLYREQFSKIIENLCNKLQESKKN